MPDRVVLASCALFGFRPDRDTSRYYRLLLNDLAANKGDAHLVVATNDPTGFDPRIETVQIDDLGPWRAKLWNEPNWQAEYIKRLGYHPKNQDLGQYKYPWMIEVYLTKAAIMLDLAKRFDKIIWLDAGLLFSVLYDHEVPGSWTGYDAELLEKKLYPLLKQNIPRVMGIVARYGLFKRNRPYFHGISYADMFDIAYHYKAGADRIYTVAGALTLDRKTALLIEQEFPAIWQKMLDKGRAGTEETVLSILRWKYEWDWEYVEQWMSRMTSVKVPE